MNESEWLVSEDPRMMLEALPVLLSEQTGQSLSDRKLRLFACACVRMVRAVEDDGRCREAVRMSERLADGLVTTDEATRTQAELENVVSPTLYYLASDCLAFQIGQGVTAILRSLADLISLGHCADILRDIVGDPFAPVTLEVRWLTSQVLTLARLAYEERARKGSVYHLAGVPCQDLINDGTLDPLTLCALADALEEAGCVGDACSECGESGADPDVTATALPCPECGGEGRLPHTLLAHLRSPGQHYRGCWAVDLLLGKE